MWGWVSKGTKFHTGMVKIDISGHRGEKKRLMWAGWTWWQPGLAVAGWEYRSPGLGARHSLLAGVAEGRSESPSTGCQTGGEDKTTLNQSGGTHLTRF